MAASAAKVHEETTTDDVLTVVPGFKPITAYSIDQPNLVISYETEDSLAEADADDPKHLFRPNHRKIQFRWGVFLCTDPAQVEVLNNKPGIWFEDMKPGEPAPICPKANCRFSCRNKDAMLAHIAGHLD